MQFWRRVTGQGDGPSLSENAAPHGGECGERNAVYRVTWDWPGTDGAFFPLAVHADSPTLDLNQAYVGPLCPEEVNLLRGNDRTRWLNPQWSFEITDL
jgi:hypothetical protein